MNMQSELIREVIVIPPVFTLKQIPIHKRQLRVAAYCRVSTGQEEQLTSYENQKRYYTEKILENKEWTLAEIFADEGISGTSARKRPEFLRMIMQCQKGKVDMVLTKSISRFARNTVDCLSYVRILRELKIPVIFEKENINTMDADSELMITIHGGLAQAESESLSKNVQWGQRNSLKNGKVRYHYKKWYGYVKGEDGKPKIIPEQAEVVKYIYSELLAGNSVRGIRDALNERQIPVKDGKGKWSGNGIHLILNNEKYTGDALGQKTYIENCLTKKVIKNNGELPKYLVKNAHQGIIPRETFERVQEELARRSSKKKVSDKSSKTEFSKYCSKYALTEILVCGECGASYKRVTWSKPGRKKIVWRCISRLDYGSQYCKESPSLEECRLHKAILESLNSIMHSKGYMQQVLRDNLYAALTPDTDRPSSFMVKRRIRELQAAMMDLVSVSVQNGNPDLYDSRFKEISTEIKLLQESLGTYAEEQNQEESLKRRVDGICKAFEQIPDQLTEYDDRLVRQLIGTVKVIGQDKLLVVYKNGFEMEQRMFF